MLYMIGIFAIDTENDGDALHISNCGTTQAPHLNSLGVKAQFAILAVQILYKSNGYCKTLGQVK